MLLSPRLPGRLFLGVVQLPEELFADHEVPAIPLDFYTPGYLHRTGQSPAEHHMHKSHDEEHNRCAEVTDRVTAAAFLVLEKLSLPLGPSSGAPVGRAP